MIFSSFQENLRSRFTYIYSPNEKVHPQHLRRSESKSSVARGKSEYKNSEYDYDEPDDDDDDDDDSDSYDDSSSISSTSTIKENSRRKYQFALIRYIENKLSFLTNENVKAFFTWCLDYAYVEMRISAGYEDLSLILTVFTFLAPSIVYLAFPKSADYPLTIMMTICFAIFVAELVIATYSKTTVGFINKEMVLEFKDTIYEARYSSITWKGYFGSKMFFLQILMIVSLFPDIPAIAKMIQMKNISNNNYIMDLRFLRMLRMLRVIKAYFLILERERHKQQKLNMIDKSILENNPTIIEQIRDLEKRNKSPSKLSEQLSSSITIRVVALIVVFIIVLPLFQYPESNNVISYSARALQSINMQTDLTHAVKAVLINSVINKMGNLNIPAVYLKLSPYSSNPIVNDVYALNHIRDIAIATESNAFYNSRTHINYITLCEYSVDSFLRQVAVLTIVSIIVVCVIAAAATYVVNRDIANLVLRPITRMIKVVEQVGKNPLAKLRFKSNAGIMGSFETDLLENTFVKIAGLLRVCFGEAGAGIIKANLAIDDVHNSAVINPLLPGVRVYCIVGFCDIHRFDFVLRRLGQDVLVFVNTIAAIVHESVHQWEGTCNKNLGNAFVLIWRIGDEETLKKFTAVTATRRNSVSVSFSSAKQDFVKVSASTINANARSSAITASAASSHSLTNHVSPHAMPKSAHSRRHSTKVLTIGSSSKVKVQRLDLKRLPGVDLLAAKALIGFLKVIAELNTNISVHKYHLDPLLRSGGKNFDLHMGFGLHAGWAIEGAVGSLQKVDATYLSPHINMAARLETASRQYGVPLLVSQDFYELLSPYVQSLMRRLDVVTVKGSENPIGIYTYDVLPIKNIGGLLKRATTLQRPTSKHSKSSVSFGKSKSSRHLYSNNNAATVQLNHTENTADPSTSHHMDSKMKMRRMSKSAEKSKLLWRTDSLRSVAESIEDDDRLVQPFKVNGPSIVRCDSDLMDSSNNLKSARTDGCTLAASSADDGACLTGRHSQGSVESTADDDNKHHNNNGNSNVSKQTDERSRVVPSRISFSESMATYMTHGGVAIAEETAQDDITKQQQHIEMKSPRPTKTPSMSDLNPEDQDIVLRLRKSKYKRNPKNPILNCNCHPDEVFELDRDIVYLRSHVKGEFLDMFSSGVKKYIAGDWPAAKIIFEKCDVVVKGNVNLIGSTGDGPSQTLLKYMASFGTVAPPHWQGYRPLTSK